MSRMLSIFSRHVQPLTECEMPDKSVTCKICLVQIHEQVEEDRLADNEECLYILGAALLAPETLARCL